jgi:hypothetical protein
MTGNPLPWIVLSAIVAVTLVLKGYVKFPSSRTAAPSTGPATTVQSLDPFATHGPVDIDALVKVGSYALGVAFAKAVRAEAEMSLACTVARDAETEIRSRFTAPFKSPAPAGQNPNQAGVPPSP